MKKSWLLVCLVNFLIASLMGVTLRAAQVFPLGLDYQFLIHGHSHTAMLGWAYLALFGLIAGKFFPAAAGRYQMLFAITQLSVVGMMISFPIKGYFAVSIAFSTLQIVCSYVFAWRAWLDLPREGTGLLKTALVFMVVSTLGAWMLGLLGATGHKGTPLYYASLQFFLHFQFNGWMIFAVLALMARHLQTAGATPDVQKLQRVKFWLIAATILTFGLPLSWYFSHGSLLLANGAGVAIQAYAFILLAQLKIDQRIIASSRKRWLIYLALGSLGLKGLLQLTTLHPGMLEASHTVRQFTIGFIHLCMLGVVTGMILFLVDGFRRLGWMGIAFLCAGFFATELMLFVQGASTLFGVGSVAYYPQLMLVASFAFPIGITLMLIDATRVKSSLKLPNMT